MAGGAAAGGGRLRPAAAHDIVAAVDDYTVGYTIREGFSVGRARQRRVPAAQPVVAEGGDLPETDRFEDGLEWLLDGFAAKLGL